MTALTAFMTSRTRRGVPTPMVSATSISSQPRALKRRATSTTLEIGTSPW